MEGAKPKKAWIYHALMQLIMYCGYNPAKKASATITAINPSTIPIATNVS